MIKLVVLFTVLALGAALPTIFHDTDGTAAVTALSSTPILSAATPILAGVGVKTVIAPETIQVHEPAIAKVGDIVQKIPTSVSHQSQTVVHEHADVRTPIVAPAVRTYTSHIIKAYSTPLVYAAAAPVLNVLRH